MRVCVASVCLIRVCLCWERVFNLCVFVLRTCGLICLCVCVENLWFNLFVLRLCSLFCVCLRGDLVV